MCPYLVNGPCNESLKMIITSLTYLAQLPSNHKTTLFLPIRSNWPRRMRISNHGCSSHRTARPLPALPLESRESRHPWPTLTPNLLPYHPPTPAVSQSSPQTAAEVAALGHLMTFQATIHSYARTEPIRYSNHWHDPKLNGFWTRLMVAP